MNDILCVILARRDNERLPEKHLQTIDGVTLIRQAINKVLSADLFDKVILSTDCPKCIDEGRDAGIDIIERAPDLCKQTSCMANAFRDAVEKSIEMYGKLHRWGCMFQPTHFLVSTNLIQKMYNIISTPANDSRSNEQPLAVVDTESHLYPWFFDLRPGASACNRKRLEYHDTLGEISVDIHNQQDLEQARLLYKWKETVS